MNSEDKIYNKIKNASQKREKDFPGMDKVWNRVEEKLDNTIVVQKKNNWQKVAIAATVLLSFSIIYHFVSNDEISKPHIQNSNPTENPVLVSKDSVEKIMDKGKEVVVDNNKPKDISNEVNSAYNSEQTMESNFQAGTVPQPDATSNDEAKKIDFESVPVTLEEKESHVNVVNYDKNWNAENKISFNNSALNSSSSNNGYLATGKKYEAPAKEIKSKYKIKPAKSAKYKTITQDKNEDIVIIDGVVTNKKELDKISTDDIEVTHYAKPLYFINGIEFTEESLFGKKPTSPYAPLDKQEIITINVIKAEDAMKIYGKKGENGVIIITTKDGKPVKK